ncbi:conserved hypothetical protein [Pseudarthrobacter chlorophenolicus A6]|uniref:Glycoside hydrolase family 42 N-terminal domain-containing protein n=1 Tax=Pseudarthrobacter chlorophenolicus (strain ATCC 700700 / DSM 12829 / CIP 107037 / JCM 12360 / KCTC 9906 / NCIMB 13794 / A6) TaxID=452863 RepID=B8H8W4_PSECP|nr:hypothetical protein [Pseudarthrobacter chlorophenolicus]ACL41859.1 conserved hypothetical protein [Pseudarthrobacter chlorophenolicus A6]SDQ57302.1 hypothetical protein SAMN04489738_1567 [Pseudarthrobacter chlorophenolicus]
MKPLKRAVLAASLTAAAIAINACQGSIAIQEFGKIATERNELAPQRSLRTVDGGLNYYGKFNNPLPATPDYFPIGIWLETILNQDDVRNDSEAGINLYVDLAPSSDLSLLDGLQPYALSSTSAPGDNGAVLADEADMWAGPGEAAWTGNWPGQGPICEPENIPCGYSLQKQLAASAGSSRLIYGNYGKGVTFWETDAQASRFINEYQNVVSADNYWFTDPNICSQGEGGALVGGERPLTESECRLAANYGWTVDRVRSLVSPLRSIPVWSFVELGQPFEASKEAITGAQIRAAVWSSIIHGAIGIVYFNHSFGGNCRSFHLLREPCAAQMRSDVTTLNNQLAELAPVLNSSFLDGALTYTGRVQSAVKIHGESLYIFAGSAQVASQKARFDIPCLANGSGTVVVLNEDRSIEMSNGSFSDTFENGNSVHLYRIDGAATLCAP